MKKLKLLLKAYGHMLLPVIYLPFYMAAFIYLENRPVGHLHIIETEIDQLIPFCEYFIIPYYLWFVYILMTVVTFMFLDRKDYYKLCFMLGIGMTAFLFISYLYPNGLALRPAEFARDNFCTELVKLLYKTDTSTNVLPSIHCYNSIVANAAIWKSKTLRRKKGICISSLTLCILILLSTLFLKQHSFVDLVAALLMFIVCYIPFYAVPERKYRKHKKIKPMPSGI